MKLILITLISIYFAGCINNPQTIEDSQNKKDSTTVIDTLYGRIIFADYHDDDFPPSRSTTIKLLDLSNYSRKTVRQFSGKRIWDFSVSFDSQNLAYYVEDYITNKIYVMSSSIDTTGNDTIIVSSDSYGSPALPNWTSDNRIAYLFGGGFSWQLKIQHEAVNIGRNFAASRVSFSKDGTKMAFSAYDDSVHSSLYVYDLVQSTTKLLVQSDTSYSISRISDPAISPDGQTIVFVKSYANVTEHWEFIDGATEIGTVRIDGNNIKMITKIGDPLADPTWSPDGKKIGFVLGNQIFVINPDGSGKKKLTNDIVNSFCWIK